MAYRFFDRTKPKPKWLLTEPKTGNANTLRGWKYYVHLWNATPPWADRDEILAIYRARKPWEQTDHIAPLINNFVCGLHCTDNLRNIDTRINQQKSNKYWPGSPFEQDCFVGEVIEPHQLSMTV